MSFEDRANIQSFRFKQKLTNRTRKFLQLANRLDEDLLELAAARIANSIEPRFEAKYKLSVLGKLLELRRSGEIKQEKFDSFENLRLESDIEEELRRRNASPITHAEVASHKSEYLIGWVAEFSIIEHDEKAPEEDPTLYMPSRGDVKRLADRRYRSLMQFRLKHMLFVSFMVAFLLASPAWWKPDLYGLPISGVFLLPFITAVGLSLLGSRFWTATLSGLTLTILMDVIAFQLYIRLYHPESWELFQENPVAKGLAYRVYQMKLLWTVFIAPLSAAVGARVGLAIRSGSWGPIWSLQPDPTEGRDDPASSPKDQRQRQ